jgi:peptide/nickel transport system ATP-binding protein
VRTYRASGGLFSRGGREVKAVQSVSLSIPKGSSLALVGESGSGKTTMAKCVIGLERPDSGDILLDGQPMTGISRAQMRAFRRDVQMVFQDPFASLNRVIVSPSSRKLRSRPCPGSAAPCRPS